MDGKNAIGRRISLLNDDEPCLIQRYPAVSISSRTSSYTSTPALSPKTPHLIRSDSTDSAAMQTPSPVTPHFSFEGLTAPRRVDSPSCSVASSSCSYGSREVACAYLPAHQQPPTSQQLPLFQPSLTSAPERRLSSPAPRPAPSKKNQYPCPMAKQLGCTDYFTTSGHAARHAKKHTGKKDAFCPECNKAFTRKDNMEQHRRTHQSGRGASKSSSGSSTGAQTKKLQHQQKSRKGTKPAPLRTTSCIPIDPSLSMPSPFPQPLTAIAVERPHIQSFPRLRPGAYASPTVADFAMSRCDDMSPGLAHGLETLAIVASGQELPF